MKLNVCPSWWYIRNYPQSIHQYLLLNLSPSNDKNPTTYIELAFERFTHHQLALALIDDELQGGKSLEDFITRWGTAGTREYYNSHGIVSALAVLLPEKISKEIFELIEVSSFNFEEDVARNKAEQVYAAFIDSLLWRTSESILIEKTDAYLIKEARGWIKFSALVDVLFQLCTISAHPYNAEWLESILANRSWLHLDALWTQGINSRYFDETEEPGSLQRLINWIDERNLSGNTSEELEFLRLTSITLTWQLSSSNRMLRDKATKILIRILLLTPDKLVEYVDKYRKGKDPYMVERVWGIAYGVCLQLDKADPVIGKLARLAYKKIYKQKHIVNHALVRSYSRGIIEYADFLGMTKGIDVNTVRQARGTGMPPESDYKKLAIQLIEDNSNRKHPSAESAIFMSMVTNIEHGGYGDFGRYVFESRLGGWDRNDVLNAYYYALYLIFKEYKYSDDVFGMRDDRRSRYYGRHYSKEERIGKKYQWIALHEIAARFVDSYDWDGSAWDEESDPSSPFPAPFYFHRDIELSLNPLPKNSPQDGSRKIFTPDYHFDFKLDDVAWLKKNNDLPSFSSLFQITRDSTDWICLEGHPEWRSIYPGESEERFLTPERRIWYWFRSYFIKSSDLEQFVSWVQNQNFHRNDLPDHPTVYHTLQREYHWVNMSAKPNDPDFILKERENAWLEDFGFGENESIPAMLTSNSYLWSEEYDHSKEGTVSFLRPSVYLFHSLGLKHGTYDGEFYSEKTGELVCFDPHAFVKHESALFIRKSALLEFLAKENLSVVWGMFGEKQILKEQGLPKGRYPGRIDISAFAYISEGHLISKSESILSKD